MITLRKGKTKNILESSISSAITAVETYNRPMAKFRTENYIMLMIVAWTKLFHAYFLFQKESKYLFFNISKTKKYTKTPKKIPNTVKIKFF